MKEKIHSAETVAIAKEQLLSMLKPNSDYETYEFEILQEERKGLLGIGAREAEVRIKVEVDKTKKAKTVLERLLKTLGVQSEVKERGKRRDGVEFELAGEDADEFFQELGKARESFEFLLNLLINRGTSSRFFKARLSHIKRNPAREQFLKNQSVTLARQVLKEGREVSLPAMNSYERSLVHNAVRDMEGVMTESEGRGPDRHVVIKPA